MSSRLREPVLEIAHREGLPYLVEHWYLGSAPRRYMMVRRFREVLEHARLEPGLRVLDLGCGWAFGTLWARAAGCTAVGIDLGMDQLQWARREMAPTNPLALALANAGALPFPDASFERVVSVEMMEHVFRPDRPKVLAEIARVLKPGGRFAISTPNASSPIEVVKRAAVRWPLLRRSLPSSCFPEAADKREAYHPYRYHHPLPLGELREGARAARLKVEGAKRFLWVMKTMPRAVLGAGRAAEAVAEALPLINRLGATTLIWGVREGR